MGNKWRLATTAFLAVLVLLFGFGGPGAAEAAARTTTPPRAVIAPPSTYVLDHRANVVSASTRAALVRPVASLTKLMTAMVLLDASPDLERTVAFVPERHHAYRNWMRFRRGDRISGRDLLLATLVGSQNITARMLVEYTPYSESEFVERMNAKARALGLTRTRFTDVHGLDPANVSTAVEVASLFTAALDYPDISSALRRRGAEAVVMASNGHRRIHRFSHTNVLLARWQRFATEASKTGYLHEAGDAIAMRVRDPQSGRQFTIVTLGEPRRAPRFHLARVLADRAIRTQRIARAK